MSKPDPTFCSLSGTVLDATGAVMQDILVKVRVAIGVREPACSPAFGNSFVSGRIAKLYTDDQGGFTVDLPRGATCRIQIDESDIDATFTVPSAASADLSDLTLRAYAP